MSELVGPSPQIKWAKPDHYEGQTLVKPRELGVVRMVFGDAAYDLKLTGAEHTEIVPRRTKGDGGTRIYVGQVGNFFSYNVAEARGDMPFDMNDTQRISDVVGLVASTIRLDLSYIASQNIERNTVDFLRDIKVFIPEEDIINVQQALAVALDKLQGYVSKDYPEKFLALADKMDIVGVAAIHLSSMKATRGSWTPEHIRKVFEPQTQERKTV